MPDPTGPPTASAAVPDVGELLLAAVPMARALGIEFTDVTPQRAVARLPDQPAFHNHVGGPHAGALFTLGDSASGAVVLAAFSEQLARAVPLVARAGITYLKLARGDVTATAVLDRPAAQVVAELDAGQRPEFAVRVSAECADGAVAAEMTVIWTLRPNR